MTVASRFALKDQDGDHSLEITVTIAYAGERPSEADCLKAVDHLLSSIPGATETDGKGADRKGQLVAKFRDWRLGGIV